MPSTRKFSFRFSFGELIPVLEFQKIAEQQTAMSAFGLQDLLDESIQKRRKEQSQESVLAEAATSDYAKDEQRKEKTGDEMTRTYKITYFNPETHKAEVLETKSEIKVKDLAKAMIDESIGAQSSLPVYSFIAAPLIRKEVVPWKLEEILSQREYGTPPPTSGGATVVPMRVVEMHKQDQIAIVKRENEIREAVIESIVRKEKSELKIEEEILLLEEAVGSLVRGNPIDEVIARLPALSRARYILAMRKRGIGRNAIVQMLLRDAFFLKKLKKKLETFTLDDLLDIVKMLRRIKKK